MYLKISLILLTVASVSAFGQEQDIQLSFPGDSTMIVSKPWYSYQDSKLSDHIVKFYTDGFKVSLGSVQTESEALMIKRELSYKIGIDLLYIYKEKDKYLLRLGDFTDNGAARLMMFQLIQMGYTKAKVIPDKVYSF